MTAMARQAARAAADGKAQFVVVDPVLQGGALNPLNEKTRWLPVKPATDAALMLGMIRWMLENNKINTTFLSSPNLAAAREKGFNSWTNATHLVITDPQHPHYRKMLAPEDIGLSVPPPPEPAPGTEAQPAPKYFVVMDKASGKPALHSASKEAELFFAGTVTGPDGQPIKVETSMNLLKASAMKYTYEQYAEACGVPKEQIIALAREFTSHGTRVCVSGLGGTAAANGLFAAWGLTLLPALVGACNKKGGVIPRRLQYKSFTPGPRYDLTKYPGMAKTAGARIDRCGFPYEKTSEYKNKMAKGEKPYPSKFPWHPVNGANDNQAIFSIANGYPYQAKIVIFWMTNPLMTSPAAGREEVINELKKPERVPLIIACDAFMGESTSLADYILPDTTQYESWGVWTPEGNVPTKASTIRWPVVIPMTPKIGPGRYACYENFLIDVAKKIGVPGFGDQAIPDKDGNLYPLNTPADFFLKAVANVAFDGTPVPAIQPEETRLQELDQATGDWRQALKPKEWPPVLYVLSRGGRFEDYGGGFEGDNHKYPSTGVFNVYSEVLATSRNSFTGEFYPGVMGWYPEALADGTPLDKAFPPDKWPFKAVSYKAKFRSVSMLTNAPIMQDLGPANFIEMNSEDAAKLGLKDGQRVKLVAATGAQAMGQLRVRPGIARGALGVAFGYGHWEYGSRDGQFGSQAVKGEPRRGTGICLSRMSLTDPSVKGLFAYSEMATGGPGRNGGAYRVEPA
ncbi:dehydrogenase [Moorella sp. Hama-1]|nr:dehydrogenase [Moorella sp. Hama-1]